VIKGFVLFWIRPWHDSLLVNQNWKFERLHRYSKLFRNVGCKIWKSTNDLI